MCVFHTLKTPYVTPVKQPHAVVTFLHAIYYVTIKKDTVYFRSSHWCVYVRIFLWKLDANCKEKHVVCKIQGLQVRQRTHTYNMRTVIGKKNVLIQ